MSPCNAACRVLDRPMKQQSQSLEQWMEGYIETFWEMVISEAKERGRSGDEMAGLFYQRARYFISKMEQSLSNIEVQPLPHLQHKQKLGHLTVPVIQAREDDPPTLQFNQLCHAISQQQLEQQGNLLAKNNVSQRDLKISQQSIQQAIALFELQLKKNPSFVSRSSIQQRLSMAKGKRGIIYMIGSQYGRAAEQFRSIIGQLQQKRQQNLHLIAEYTFLLGNCHLLLDQPGCEMQAQRLFLKSLDIYLVHLISLGYQTKDFTLPRDGKPVDRFAYLNKPNDPPSVKTTKEVMSIILDKIEDVHELIRIKAAFSQQRKAIITKYERRRLQEVKEKQTKVVLVKMNRRRSSQSVQGRHVAIAFEECKQEDKGGRCIVE